MGLSSFNQQSSQWIMDDQDLDSISPSSDQVCSFGSLDSMEEVTSSSSSPTSSSSGYGPFSDMSSLLQQLPLKRGLSKHYNWKSQSFRSLSNVRCLEDLAKPENPYNKKVKICKSYGGGLSESHGSNHLPRSNISSRLISKKASRISCSLLGANRLGSFLNNKSSTPIPPPKRSTTKISFSSAHLFA